MSYKVTTIAYFDKQFKRLAKKFPSLKSELLQLISKLSDLPETGIALGHECYKIKLGIASKGKGKSGGARVITYIAITEETVVLLSIYDKSEQADISDKELLRLLDEAR